MIKKDEVKNTFLEMVELEDGSYALQKSDADDAPLVTIHFSEEAKEMMVNNDAEIAKVMVNAGAQAVAAYHQNRAEAEKKHRVIH